MKLITGVGCFLLLCVLACENQKLDRLIQFADGEWIKGRNQSAIEILKTILKKKSTGRIAEKVLFRLGEIHYFSLKNSAKALFYFQELQHLNKKSPQSFTAQEYIAEIVEYSLKDLDQAIIEYQKLIDEYDYLERKGNYQFRIASIYFKKQDYDQAIVELEILLENFIDSPLAEEAAFKITSILHNMNRCEESRKRYQWFMKTFKKSRFISEMNFIMASCFEAEGQFEKAYEGFKAIEAEYPYPTVLRMKLKGIENRLKKKRGKKKKSPYRLKPTSWIISKNQLVESKRSLGFFRSSLKITIC